MNYFAVTTCNAAQWLAFGRTMVSTFKQHWPAAVPLRLYTEGFNCDIEGVEASDLDSAASWLMPWKAERTKQQRGLRPSNGKNYDYHWDAVRFSHKIAALGAAAQSTDADVLIWMDADIVTRSPITRDWLEELFPDPANIAWLDRARKYPECGFIMFRLPSARPIIDTIVLAYKSGAIFSYPETHDSYVIQRVVEAAASRNEVLVHSLSGEARQFGHPFCSGPLGSRMDHLKGAARKRRGRSFQADFGNNGPYWR